MQGSLSKQHMVRWQLSSRWLVISMLETDKVFAGSVPENYDRYMVPLTFKPYAADLAKRSASFAPMAVLETAASTGVVTRCWHPDSPPAPLTPLLTSISPCSTTPHHRWSRTVVSIGFELFLRQRQSGCIPN